MPDRELVHSTVDVTSTLLYAFDSGFHVRVDSPQLEPRPRMLAREEVSGIKHGVFFLFLPKWQFGEFQVNRISAGHNRGMYDVSPRVNYAPVTVYFGGERIDEGRRRFGSGVLSYHRDWLEMPAKAVHRSPPEVESWFKRIFAHLSSGVTVRAGVHRYHICRGVVNDLKAAQTLPPFDFIPWNRDLLRRGVKQQKVARRSRRA